MKRLIVLTLSLLITVSICWGDQPRPPWGSSPESNMTFFGREGNMVAYFIESEHRDFAGDARVTKVLYEYQEDKLVAVQIMLDMGLGDEIMPDSWRYWKRSLEALYGEPVRFKTGDLMWKTRESGDLIKIFLRVDGDVLFLNSSKARE